MAALDELTKQAVRGVGGFLKFCDMGDSAVVFGQFRRVYESLAERVERHQRLPADVRPKVTNRDPNEAAKRLSVFMGVDDQEAG